MNFTETLQNITKKSLSDCSNQELYLALLEIVRQKSADRSSLLPEGSCTISVQNF